VKNEEKDELIHGLGRFWDTKKIKYCKLAARKFSFSKLSKLSTLICRKKLLRILILNPKNEYK
jgi:hypothetical protein